VYSNLKLDKLTRVKDTDQILIVDRRIVIHFERFQLFNYLRVHYHVDNSTVINRTAGDSRPPKVK